MTSSMPLAQFSMRLTERRWSVPEMDIVALDFVTAVAIAGEQIEIGTDLIAMEEALFSLRDLQPDHDLVSKLEGKIARCRSGSVLVGEARRLRSCARAWDLD